jgi:hypothetical protein
MFRFAQHDSFSIYARGLLQNLVSDRNGSGQSQTAIKLASPHLAGSIELTPVQYPVFFKYPHPKDIPLEKNSLGAFYIAIFL